MLKLVRTDFSNADFRNLIPLLDRELAERDGDNASFYAQFNKIDNIPCTLVAYADGKPAACGAIKKYSDDTVEVKRMFVHPDFRRQGMAERILLELESWAQELSFRYLILETGTNNPGAIALYQKNGYYLIPNYDQYVGVDKSVCMKKEIAGRQ